MKDGQQVDALMVNIASRAFYAVLKISGKDVLTYLQGQITQDIEKLSHHQALYTAVLSPQAKAVADCYLLQTQDDEVMLLCPRAQAARLVERLKRFMLGYNLRLGVVSSWHVWSIQGATVDGFLAEKGLAIPEKKTLAVQASSQIYVLRMPEASADGVWLIGADGAVQENVDESVMEQARILKGIPQFGIDWDEKTHPLNANLMERDGVSFDKGCYVGQEVTSRMHWRGGIKRKLYRVQLKGGQVSLPCAVRLDGVKVGILTSLAVDATGCQKGIAWLPIEIAIREPILSVDDKVELMLLGACER